MFSSVTERGKKKKRCSEENSEFLPLFKHVFMQLSKLPINIALHIQQCFVNSTEEKQTHIFQFSMRIIQTASDLTNALSQSLCETALTARQPKWLPRASAAALKNQRTIQQAGLPTSRTNMAFKTVFIQTFTSTPRHSQALERHWQGCLRGYSHSCNAWR